ncbi:PadR family transcriptional regulator [Gemmatimonadota bacterium]
MADDHLEIQNLTRSCNEMLILASLAGGRRHGYEIGLFVEEKSDGRFRFNHGTLYPILHNLEKQGHIRGGWEKEGSKRQRKYYTLTARGKRYARDRVRLWKEFTGQLREITRELDS